jgi:hypothetical protein
MIADHLKRGGFVALVFAVIALVSAAFWGSESATTRSLASHGVTTQAYVVHKHTEACATPAEAVHEVTYLYQSLASDGTREIHRVEHQVPARIFDAVAIGGQVGVRYLPEDPAMAAVYPGEHSDGRTFLDILALVAAMAAFVDVLGGLQQVRRGQRPAAQPA